MFFVSNLLSSSQAGKPKKSRHEQPTARDTNNEGKSLRKNVAGGQGL